jgi:hypothetical protein
LTRLRWVLLAFIAGTTFAVGSCSSSNSTSSLNATPIIGCGTPPVPSCGLFPPNITVGSEPFVLQVAGSGFIDTSTAGWNGFQRAVSFETASTQLSVMIPPTDVASVGIAQVTVTNPAPGGGESSAVTFVINAAQNNGPTISASSPFSPQDTAPGGPAFTLTVSGTNFAAGDFVSWNGSPRTTTVTSSTQISAQINNTDIATCGFASVAVETSTPGIASPSVNFTITGPCVPTVTSISPTSATVGSGPGNSLTVNGSNFTNKSQVLLNGSPLETTYVSASELTAPLTSSAVATAGSFVVTVWNPGGGVSPFTPYPAIPSQPVNIFTVEP